MELATRVRILGNSVLFYFEIKLLEKAWIHLLCGNRWMYKLGSLAKATSLINFQWPCTRIQVTFFETKGFSSLFILGPCYHNGEQGFICHNWSHEIICWKLREGPLDGIQCPHRADEYRFLQVGQHWGVHVWEPTGELHLLSRTCFSSSVEQVLFNLFQWFMCCVVEHWLFWCVLLQRTVEKRNAAYLCRV